MKPIRGIVGTPVTPFSKDKSLDEQTLRKIVEFQISNNRCHAISVPQHMGESLNMTEGERKKVAEVCIDQVNGRMPVMIHVSCTGTDMTASLAKHAKDAGADAIISTVPYHWRPGPEATLAHYEQLLESIDAGVLAYNFPERLGVSLSPDLLFKLASKHDNFIGMKDASYNIQYFTDVCRIMKGLAHEFVMFTGVEYPVAGFALGGGGTFSALGGIVPDTVKKLYDLCEKGKLAEALPVQYRIAELQAALRTKFPASVKTAMEIMERPVGNPRLPLLPLSNEEKSSLVKVLEKTGLYESDPKGWENR